MPGTLQVGGNTVITHTGDAGAGTNTINSAVVFPAGTVIGNASLSYAELGEDLAGTSSAFALAHMDTKSHTANCSVTFDSDQWSFDQAGDYLLSVSLVFYRSDNCRIAIFTNVGGTVSLAYMGQFCYYDNSQVGAGTLHINGYRFSVAASEITGQSGVVKYGVYRFSSNSGGTYVPTSFSVQNTAPKHSQVTILRVAQ